LIVSFDELKITCTVIIVFFLQREHSEALASVQLPDLATSLQELEQDLLQFSSDGVPDPETR